MKALLPCTVAVACILLPTAGVPAPVAVPGFVHVKTVEEIDEYRFEANGLTVLLLPEHSSPTVTLMVTYRVGSRNEVTGTTGATHLLEHLMFKGSPTHNRPDGTSLDQFLEQVGARYNATTWLDRTNYYATVGSEHLEGYMAIEADRMRNLWLREDDRRLEMTVVRNEFERGENDPVNALDVEVYAAAYLAHPYHHSTIGWRSDIENVPIQKLREFYDTFYWPDNATVTIVGDFEPAAALGLVRKYYGAFPSAPQPIPEVYTQEPAQTGPRRVTVKRAGRLGVVAVAHKIPSGRHPDYPALAVAGDILTDGKNSRLFRTLTDQNLTTRVFMQIYPFHDPSLATVFALLAPGSDHSEVERIIREETERVRREGVTPAEVDTAVAKARAASAYRRDGSFAIANSINQCIAAGDWTLYYSLEEDLQRVTAADVQRVMKEYFDEDQSTTGWFVPLVPEAPVAP